MTIKYHKLYPKKGAGKVFHDQEFEELLRIISEKEELYTDEIIKDLELVYKIKESLQYLREKYGIIYNISL